VAFLAYYLLGRYVVPSYDSWRKNGGQTMAWTSLIKTRLPSSNYTPLL
jgi:hypothetical protein